MWHSIPRAVDLPGGMVETKVQCAATNRYDEARQREITLRVMAPLCLAAFAGVMNILAPATFLDEIVADLDSSVPLVGQAVSIALITAAFVGLFVGLLADVVGRQDEFCRINAPRWL